MRVIVLGIGEIGNALCELYQDKKVNVYKKDLKITSNLLNVNEIDVLNVCIPYTEDFVDIVSCEILKFKPKLTIIHSTVPVGTTENIYDSVNCNIVNSPVVGSHPFLKKSLTTFVKYVGYNDKVSKKLTKKHYKFLNIKYKMLKGFKTTETIKLLCTSYYGLCISWHDYINDVCLKNNIDFSVIKMWNMNYNKGYKKLKLSKYCRPILDPPKNKKIGGHCVIPNAKLLNLFLKNDLIDYLLKFE